MAWSLLVRVPNPLAHFHKQVRRGTCLDHCVRQRETEKEREEKGKLLIAKIVFLVILVMNSTFAIVTVSLKNFFVIFSVDYLHFIVFIFVDALMLGREGWYFCLNVVVGLHLVAHPCRCPCYAWHLLLGLGHTWYLSFFLHEQNFWRIKFTPKNANFSR